jgi:protein required for attachment to host cells
VLGKLVRGLKVRSLVIAASPLTLADLRQVLHKDFKAHVIAEVDKDFTKQPLYEIEKHLAG